MIMYTCIDNYAYVQDNYVYMYRQLWIDANNYVYMYTQFYIHVYLILYTCILNYVYM